MRQSNNLFIRVLALAIHLPFNNARQYCCHKNYAHFLNSQCLQLNLFHLISALFITIYVTSACATSLSPSIDLLHNVSWQWTLTHTAGGQGHLDLDHNRRLRIDKTNDPGNLFFYNRRNIPITPGQAYLVTAHVQTTGDARAFLMVAMPGSHRTPYPTSPARTHTTHTATLRLRFVARQDETNLRVHIVVQGQGSVRISQIDLQPQPPVDRASLQWGIGGSALDTCWSARGAYAICGTSRNLICAKLAANGAIGCDSLTWPAAKVNEVEIGWRADQEPGYLTMKWTARDGGKTYAGSTSSEYLADGHWHALLFDVSHKRRWRGTITSLWFVVHSRRKPARMALAYVRGLPAANLIPNAHRALPVPSADMSPLHNTTSPNHHQARSPFGGWHRASDGTWTVAIPRIRPATQYRLDWIGRPGSASASVRILNYRYQTIQTFQLRRGAGHLDFTAPPMTVTAQLVLQNAGNDAVPRLRVTHRATQPTPHPWWNANWIWSHQGVGPIGTVWFERTFQLPAQPGHAAMIMTADDAFTLWVNGHRLPGGTNWQLSKHYDLTHILHPGKNEIRVRVRNDSAWGGLLGQLYAQLPSGQSFRLATDQAWTCVAVATRADASTAPAPPEKIDQPVVVIGKPPVQPWGANITYHYIGPIVKMTLSSSANRPTVAGSLHQPTLIHVTAHINRKPPVSANRLNVVLYHAHHRIRHLSASVQPATGDWPPHGPVNFTLTLPPHFWVGTTGSTFKLALSVPWIRSTAHLADNNVPVATITVPSRPATRKLADVHVQGVGKRAHIVINGKPHAPLAWWAPVAFSRAPLGRGSMIRDVAAQNIHIDYLPGNFADDWIGPDQYDFSTLDRAIGVMLANDPKAWIILFFDFHAPAWWLKAHPKDAMRYFGHVTPNPSHDFQSMTSAAWLKDVQAGIRKLIQHIKHQPYAGRIIALSPSAGQTSEWINDMGYGHGKLLYSDYSPVAIRAYRQWLTDRYHHNMNALRKAWHKPHITFDKIQPPTPDERHHSDLDGFLNPLKSRPLMDYWRFRNDSVAHDILTLCHTIKQSTHNHWLTGVFYGYLTMFSSMYGSALQGGGHLALEQVLNSPDVDFLTSPAMYHWRKIGLADGSMDPDGSLAAHGKLYICELDERTFTESLPIQWPNGRVRTVGYTLGMLDRDFGLCVSQGMGLHWMEMLGKWFRAPVILAALGREMHAYRSLPPQPRGTTPTQVCVVTDTTSPRYIKMNGPDSIQPWLVPELLRRLNEAGFAFENVLVDDLLDPGRVHAHKLYIMTNTMVLSSQQRRRLHARFQKEHASVIWLYAPGAFTPGQPASAANVAATTGFSVRMVDRKGPRSMAVIPAWGGMTVTCRADTGPWFLPTGQDVRVIARNPHGQAMMVRRKQAGRSIWFSTIPNLPPALLRRIARAAGVWIYEKGRDPLHVGNDLIFLHAKSAGQKRILLPAHLRLRPILGLLPHPLVSGQPFHAHAGRTYGFLVEPTP